MAEPEALQWTGSPREARRPDARLATRQAKGGLIRPRAVGTR